MMLYERKVKLRTCLVIRFVVDTTGLNLIAMPKQQNSEVKIFN